MQERIEDVVAVREALPSDANFIFATWLRDLRHNDAGPLPDDLWFPPHREFINRILTDERVRVLIVHPKDAEHEILGYIVAEPEETLWWVYVKPKFRGRKLAKLLMQTAKISEGTLAAWCPKPAQLKLEVLRRPRQLRPKYASKG